MLTFHQRIRLPYAMLTVACSLAFGLAACGDRGTDTAAPKPADGSPTTSSNEQFQWELKFAQCLRAEGVQVADPDPVKGAPDVVHDDTYRAASSTCQDEIGEPPAVTANRAKQKEYLPAQLKAAKCLRASGADVADPTPDQGLFIPGDVEVSQAVLDQCLPADDTP